MFAAQPDQRPISEILAHQQAAIARIRQARPVVDYGIDLRRGKIVAVPVKPRDPLEFKRRQLIEMGRNREDDLRHELQLRLAELKELRREESIRLAMQRAEERKASGQTLRFTYASIEARAIRIFKVSKSELHGKQRSTRIVLPRQFICYWACRLTKLSLPQIGRLLGDRDHTTVLHSKLAYPGKRKVMGRKLRSLA